MAKSYQYRYLKAPTEIFEGKIARFSKHPFWPLLLAFVGLAILTYFFAPTVSYVVRGNIPEKSVPKSQVAGANTGGAYVQKMGDDFSYFVTQNERTYPYSEFKLSIPKLEIRDARVLVNAQDFQKNLAQLPGSALPGEVGNVFITGHSVLPQFFDPQNYLTIFSTLSKIGVGDEIFAEAQGLIYDYQVIKIFSVDPSDLSVISPPDGVNKYLTLMTCVPPGIGSQRLIVLTKLKYD